MTEYTIEQQVHQLIYNITRLNEHSIHWKQQIKETINKLKNHRYIDSEEHIIDKRYRDLADKFLIKGYDDLATQIIDNKRKYQDKLKNSTAPQQKLSYDLLSLLLELSDSPMKHHYTKTESNMEKSKKVIENWNDVLNEEPLEGSHWQQWDDIESDEDMMDDKSDEFEMDPTYESNKRKKKKTSTETDYNQTYWEDENNDYYLQQLQQNDKFKSNNSTPLTFNQLYNKQYWHNDFQNNIIEDDLVINSSILQKPCHLNKALHNYNSTTPYAKETYYIKESYAIREVLFFLRGYETIIFKRSEENHSSTISTVFYVNNKYSIKHLSSKSFGSMMHSICKYGNILYRLRRHIKRTVFVRKNGQTYQAFSAAISNALNDFETLIAKLETKYATIKFSEFKEIYSLLQLYDELQLPLSCLSAIHDTLLQCSNLVSSNPKSNSTNARTMSALLLSTIFNQIVNAEISGNDHIYSTMCTIFKQTFAPYSRLMDEWMFHGTLENDIANEFLVTSNKKLHDYSSQYWSDGFSIGTTLTNEDICPLFSPNFVNTILFVGKSINLCKHIDQTFSITHNDYLSLESIFSQFTINDHMPFINDNKEYATFKDSTMKDIHDDTDNSFIAFGIPKINPHQSLKSVNKKENEFMGTLFDHDFEECLQQYIKKPYENSATRLISVLQKNNGLSYYLEILTTIYFMLESNLMHLFCESIFIQMDKKQQWYDRMFLNQTFNDSCKSIDSQKYIVPMKKINVKMKLDKNDFNQPRKTSFPAGFKAITTATYLDQLTIDFEIPWPINNFIKPDYMRYYEKVMHLLLRIKRSKHVLEKKTLLIKQGSQYGTLGTSKIATSNNISNNSTRLYILRMHMIWFINSFWRYIMTTVIHADTVAFKKQIANLDDIDKITLFHNQYIMGIIDKCLLNDKSVSIKKAIVHIFDMVEQLAVLFSQSCTENIEGTLKVLEQEYQRTSDFITTSIAVMNRQVNLNWFDILSTSLTT